MEFSLTATMKVLLCRRDLLKFLETGGLKVLFYNGIVLYLRKKRNIGDFQRQTVQTTGTNPTLYALPQQMTITYTWHRRFKLLAQQWNNTPALGDQGLNQGLSSLVLWVSRHP